MNLDKWGGPETFPHMAAGWAVACNTPFIMDEASRLRFGGTRNPLVVIHWPKAHQARARLRSQFSACHRHRADRARSDEPARTKTREW